MTKPWSMARSGWDAVIALHPRLNRAVAVAAWGGLASLPTPSIAGGDFVGDWHPYSDPAARLGVMTVTREHVRFAAGPSARLEPVRENGSVFRILTSDGDPFAACGGGVRDYVAFHVLDDGMLAQLFFSADTPPDEPTGTNTMEVLQNGACSVMFYAR
ncbi:MAG: hypothetical protein HLUCCA12_01640 [Rhodobacteraceae bacterium HLUCCA12]|nr:MAG: hypothetical protein HLUCCA12_01640 [Rhodobacteraceae bacterium HLUCCA12]